MRQQRRGADRDHHRNAGALQCFRLDAELKYAWIDGQTKQFALSEMCETLEVSISGYRAWKRGGTAERKRLTAGQTLAMLRAIHVEVKGAYSSPRMVRELRRRGYTASKGRVERLMRLHGIHARHKRRYRVTTDIRSTTCQ